MKAERDLLIQEIHQKTLQIQDVAAKSLLRILWEKYPELFKEYSEDCTWEEFVVQLAQNPPAWAKRVLVQQHPPTPLPCGKGNVHRSVWSWDGVPQVEIAIVWIGMKILFLCHPPEQMILQLAAISAAHENPA